MGKIRTRIIGDETVEKKQKEEAKKKADEKKKKILEKPSYAKASEGERGKNVSEKETAKVTAGKAASTLKTVQPSHPSRPSHPSSSSKRRGKKYQEAKKLVDKTKAYAIGEAVKLLKQLKTAKFDESVELHLNVDAAGLKGEISLPHSTGKIVKVAVVNDALLTDIEKGKIDFDILVTHPSFMPKLAKFAKVLGPKGLMPNPKAGTISTNPEEVVKKFSGGLLRWKTEAKFPLIHQMIGKISFEDKTIVENALKLLNSVGLGHIQKAVIKSTMSPAIKLDIEKI